MFTVHHVTAMEGGVESEVDVSRRITFVPSAPRITCKLYLEVIYALVRQDLRHNEASVSPGMRGVAW